jgi:nucleotide-binding universal stress UspA family protein
VNTTESKGAAGLGGGACGIRPALNATRAAIGGAVHVLLGPACVIVAVLPSVHSAAVALLALVLVGCCSSVLFKRSRRSDPKRERKLGSVETRSTTGRPSARPGRRPPATARPGARSLSPRVPKRADAIFVGSRGVGGALERLRAGSVSTGVVTDAHCSVEVVRPANDSRGESSPAA